MDNEERIKLLKEEIASLEQQKKILLDFTELVTDAANAAEAGKQNPLKLLIKLRDKAFNDMKEVISVQIPPR